LSLVGETRIEVLELDEAGTAGCDFGDGIACEAKCSAGEDMDACRKPGVIKLVEPPARTFSPSCIFTFTLLPPSFVLPMIGGRADDRAGVTGDSESFRDRNPTLDSNLFSPFSLSLPFCSISTSSPVSLPFPLSGLVFRVANSSAGCGVGFVFDRVAVRNVCSREERNRLKGFPVDSSTSAVVDEVDGSW
jgi:hypothetical protein